MIYKYIIFTILISVFVSCGNSSATIETEKVEYVTHIKDINIKMPGNFYISDDFYIIEDPMNRKTIFTAYNRDNNSIAKSFCSRGNSRTEIMQAFSAANSSNILVYDLNSPKYIRFSAEEIGKIEYFGRSSVTNKMLSFCCIDDNHLVGIETNKKNNFISYCSITEKLDSLGSLPVCDLNYNNSFNTNIGNVSYNEKKSTLFFVSTAMPYYEKYKFTNGKFKFIESKTYGKYTHSIENSKIEFDFDRNNLLRIDALTDKYIIQIKKTPAEQEKNNDKIIKGIDFSNHPRHLYVYDYDFNLIKILSTDTPIIRLSVDKKNDKLYMINYNSGMYDLSELNI